MATSPLAQHARVMSRAQPAQATAGREFLLTEPTGKHSEDLSKLGVHTRQGQEVESVS